MTLREIAALLGADLDGDGAVEIRRVARIEDAGVGDITFLANPKYAKYLDATQASAVIVAHTTEKTPAMRSALLRVADPYTSFLKVLVAFNPPADPIPAGIHPTAIIASNARIGEGVRIGAHAVIGHRCVIGKGTMVGHGAVLCDDVTVGEESLLYHNVVVRERCVVGSRVILQPGVIVGGDGFGFAPLPDGTYEKIPQVGIAVIEDDVELGANTTVDRATMGETRVKKGAKLDNLIMVAHNVVIGENTVIAAQTGISGSTRIGANSMIGGQVGITGHLEIAERTKLGAQSGIHHSIHKPGMTYFGSPAYPQREAFRIQGAVTQLPDLLNTVRVLQSRLEECENELKELRSRGHP